MPLFAPLSVSEFGKMVLYWYLHTNRDQVHAIVTLTGPMSQKIITEYGKFLLLSTKIHGPVGWRLCDMAVACDHSKAYRPRKLKGIGRSHEQRN